MTGPELPELPETLKGIRHYLKIANEHDQRDIVVSYWCRLEAFQKGLRMSTKSVEETMFFMKLMDWLEKTKKANHDNEAITNDIVAQAHLENWALKLFLYADKNDREGNFNKNIIQAFYTAGYLYDLLTTFGPLNEEAERNRKYAKWRAAYIYNCLKKGETPVPGPLNGDDNDESDNTNVIKAAEDAGDIVEENESNINPSCEIEEIKEEKEVEEHEPDEESTPDDTTTQPISNRKAILDFPSVPSGLNSNLTPSESNNQDSDIPSPVNPNLYNPAPTPTNGGSNTFESSDHIKKIEGGVELTMEQVLKAQKFIKWAGSALNYDDVPTAVTNLRKALHLLTTGQELA